MDFELQGKRYLIIGGSRGIGAGIARSLAAMGAQVLITYTSNVESAEAVCSDCRQHGVEATALHCDVCDENSVRACLDASWAAGELDGIIISAGVLRVSSVADCSTEEWDLVLNTNLRGTFLCLREGGQSFRRAGRAGSIIVLSSTSGQTGSMGCAYPVSKTGQITLAKGAAKDFAGDGVRINVICPAWTATDMAADAIAKNGKSEMDSKVPLGRIGEPEDIGSAACFFAERGQQLYDWQRGHRGWWLCHAQ